MFRWRIRRQAHRRMRRAAWLGAAVLACSVTAAGADQWNERTRLEFSEAVMVPGATLQAGTYIFRLADSRGNRHMVEIAKPDGEVVAVTLAVPTKRQEPKGDIVVKFNPTEQGEPPAIASWFYPGSLYGHQFVYSDEEARKIAERTKTLVLSKDVPGTDLEKGTLRVYDASGVARAWQPNADAAASWEAWDRKRRATAGAVVPQPVGETTAPAVAADLEGMPLSVDTLEDNPSRYTGQKVKVDAEVENVHGPRVFTIDEPGWADLEGEVLVYVPTSLAAVVRENDRVTVSGTVKKFVQADFENEWGWLGIEEVDEVKLGQRPVIVATHIVGGSNNSAMVVKLEDRTGERPVGTSGGATTTGAVTDLKTLAAATDDLVGRRVDLDDVRIEALGKDHGFFVRDGERSVFVLPSTTSQQAAFRRGETVSFQGIVLQMPRHMKARVASTEAPRTPSFNDDVYIYAMSVER